MPTTDSPVTVLVGKGYVLIYIDALYHFPNHPRT